ncbi:MAG TPA: TraB/GumN family protein, partial [Flavobacteriaceae bacterium]|nr:TraB/GumN family protein [Flavobacteriaceae bacterium]
MKKLKQLFALSLLLGMVATTVAQTNENSLLWKVEGNGIKTSYVFGTFHMLPKDDFLLTEKVKKALESSEVLALELDMDDPGFQAEMMKEVMIKNGATLNDFMDADEFTLIDNYLTSKMGVGLEQLKTMKPLMVSSMVMMAYLGSDVASYEASLIGLSKEQQKEIIGLETVAEQMAIFDEQPYEEQLDEIVKLLNETDEMKSMFEQMITFYKNENIDGLYNYMDDFFHNDIDQLDRMLHHRNKNWIPKIGEYSKQKTTFYGVGAGP